MAENAHEDSPPDDKKRLRTSRACDFCRRKKVKCHFEPGNPCANCISYNVTCEFTDGTKKRGPPKGYIDALEKRIRTIEGILNKDSADRNTSNAGRQLPSPFACFAPPFAKKDEQHRQNMARMHKRQQGASADRVRYLGDLSALQLFRDKLKLGGEQDNLGEHRIHKFGRDVVLLENEKDDHDKTLAIPSDFTHGCGYWIYITTGVDRHTSDRLLKIYFANIHPVLPVVDKAEFLKQYRDQVDTYPPADLLNAMFGAAARFVETEAQQQRTKAGGGFVAPDHVWDVPKGYSDQFFDRAMQLLSNTATEIHISKVQSVILIYNHSRHLDSKSSACWLLGGIAIRMAQGVGLNRNCEEWDIPESEKQMRKRIWWSLHVTDRFQSASLGRPISIHDEDNDVAYPDPAATWREVLDEPSENDTAQPRFPSASYRPEDTPLDDKVEIYQLFIQLVKLSEILGRILQGLYTPKARKLGSTQGSDAVVTRLDHELTEWRFAFPKELERANFADFDEAKGYLAPTVASMLLCYFSLLILLHRPFIEHTDANGNKKRPLYSSFRIGTSAATRGMRIACNMMPRDFLMFPYSFSLYPVLQCCLIHMHNTKNKDARISAPARSDLRKAIALVERLRDMSSNADRLWKLLQIVLSSLDIQIDRQHENRSSHSSPIEQRSTANGATSMTTAPMSDVGRGSPHSQRMLSEGMPAWPLPPPPPAPAPAPAETVLYSSPSPTTSAGEAFTLKQFGFDTPGDPSTLDPMLQDTSAFSTLEALPPLPIYQYNDNSSHTTNTTSATTPTQAHVMYNIPFNDSSSSSQNGFAGIPYDDATVFRNNPDNPLWSMPSSMDLSEWNEWTQRLQPPANGAAAVAAAAAAAAASRTWSGHQI